MEMFWYSRISVKFYEYLKQQPATTAEQGPFHWPWTSRCKQVFAVASLDGILQWNLLHPVILVAATVVQAPAFRVSGPLRVSRPSFLCLFSGAIQHVWCLVGQNCQKTSVFFFLFTLRSWNIEIGHQPVQWFSQQESSIYRGFSPGKGYLMVSGCLNLDGSWWILTLPGLDMAW